MHEGKAVVGEINVGTVLQKKITGSTCFSSGVIITSHPFLYTT